MAWSAAARGIFLSALLVALAGCGGPLAGGSVTDEGLDGETGTVTPVPLPEENGPTEVEEIAPGLSKNAGVTDSNRLMHAHAAALANTSYTAVVISTRRAPNGSMGTRYNRSVRVESSDRFHYILRFEARDEPRRTELWRDSEEAYEATTANRTTTYQALEAPPLPTLLSSSDLQRLFNRLPTRVVETAVQNDTTVYTVEGGPRDLPPLYDVRFTARITEQGLIQSYRLNYAVEREETRRTVTVEATFTGVGETTVDRPPWYEAATESTQE